MHRQRCSDLTRDLSSNVGSSPATQPERLQVLSLCPCMRITDSHEFGMADVRVSQAEDGAGALAGLAGFMASESTGVKAPSAAPLTFLPLGFRQPSGKWSERPV
jgi:hypothetical protein